MHVITSFAQKILENQDATSNLTASNIIATIRRILTQDMERVGGRPLMASPLVVWIRGVACPETADTNVLNVKLMDIAASQTQTTFIIYYCQATLLIHGIQRYKHNAQVECDEGYNIKNKPW